MNTIMKITFSAVLSVLISGGTLYVLTAAQQGTVYYFWAQNCSACREAHMFYKKPENIKDGSSWTYNGIKFVSYRIADENSKIIGGNIKQLTNMCDAILKNTGKAAFVYYRRDVYDYYKNKNIPYYRKEEKYSRKDEPFPTPVFVIGDRVVLGFSPDLVQRSISAAK